MPRLLKIDSPDWLDVAADAINGGKIVGLAFERLFGLAVNALDPEAVHNVAGMKSRDIEGEKSRPIAVILPNREGISQFTDHFTAAAERLADRHWPGPLTLIVKARSGLPKPLVSALGLIGIRLAGQSPAAALSRRTGLPLTATSANRKDAPDALTHVEVLSLHEVDFVVEGSVAGPPGSTVVDVSGPSPRVLRQGIVQIDKEM